MKWVLNTGYCNLFYYRNVVRQLLSSNFWCSLLSSHTALHVKIDAQLTTPASIVLTSGHNGKRKKSHTHTRTVASTCALHLHAWPFAVFPFWCSDENAIRLHWHDNGQKIDIHCCCYCCQCVAALCFYFSSHAGVAYHYQFHTCATRTA